MNEYVNPAEAALAIYATACETHQRRDWREASHALAKALKLALAASVSRPAIVAADPAPMGRPAPETAKASAPPARKASTAAGARVYTMEAASLAKALRLVCKVAAKPQPGKSIPVLTMVRLEARGDYIDLTATNLDIEIQIAIQAPASGVWSALAPAHELAKLIAAAPKGTLVSIKGEADKERSSLIVEAPGRRVLFGLPLDHFPTMEPRPDLRRIDVDAASLADALAFVRPSISDEETRYYLNGTYLHGSEGTGLCLAATDGRQLSQVRIGLHVGEAFGVIVPGMRYSDTAGLIAATLTPGARLEVGKLQIRFTAGPVVILSKLIDGSFPDYVRVIPRDNKLTLTLQREPFAAAVKAAMIVLPRQTPSGDKTRAVHLTFGEGEAFIACKAPDTFEGSGKDAKTVEGAKANESVPCSYEGAHVEIGFNGDYLLDLLATFKGERVTLALGEPSKRPGEGGVILDAALLTDETAPDRLAVLMPLRA